MTDHTSIHHRKTTGVRFTSDATDSSNKHEENPLPELQWEQCCNNESPFDLYFGILKLAHSYTMTMNVVFHQTPINLEAIVDHQDVDELQIVVTELPRSHSNNRTSFQVEVLIHRDALPGPFHRTFSLCDRSKSKSVLVNVRGKILRENQGTATLRDGVHMKSILTQEEDDDEQ